MTKSYRICGGNRRAVALKIEELCRLALPAGVSEEYVRRHCHMALFSDGRAVFVVDSGACVEFVPENVEESPWEV